MGRSFAAIDQTLARFIAEQHVFFVATAPLAAAGLINLSPKGLDSFRILDPHTVAYVDLTGSGVETIAHLRENERIVIMFCAFEGPTKILRLHGRGEVLEPGDCDFDALRPRFPSYESTRSIIRVTVQRIADSCGYGVPRYRYDEDRSQLTDWAVRKGSDGVRRYQAENNRVSLDGLPALRRPGQGS